ncbi:hypothetical protein G6F65_023171 [Rhizopus arrhizus]|nr:hypothetical protein G6F65_023171 [Rhizopus arrhizus]
MAWEAGVDHSPFSRTARRPESAGPSTGRSRFQAAWLHSQIRRKRSSLAQARDFRLCRHLYPSGLLAHLALRNRRRWRHGRQLARRIPLSVPRLHVRPGWPGLQEQACSR